ncbi:MAG: glycoside hydrolase family 38 C-terminal domain-containing protein [Phycisphaerales bacterium]|nr:glycoside hydrolase family 38 C-terminal domain-containing protein [Phycisphaerales bacterium]
MLPDLEYAALRFETFADEVLRPVATPVVAPLAVTVAQFEGRPTHDEITAIPESAFTGVDPGWRWGPVWSTAWFRLRGELPEAMSGRSVHLRFDAGTEALLWRDGAPFHGFDFNRDRAAIIDVAERGESVDLLVEAACNMPLGISTFWWDHPELHARWNEAKPGRLAAAELVVYDDLAWRFVEAWDLARRTLLIQPTTSPRAHRLQAGLREILGTIPAHDPRPAMEARYEDLKTLLRGDGPASGTGTNCIAVGHAHIDTAWLWPLAETRRKCLRTFATVDRIMERSPGFRFLCSQAQQYQWIREDSPRLFERIAARVREGRWEPGGAMWIEPDCNAPSGESFIRQILHGTNWWRAAFGSDAPQRHLYLPDTFGFPASMPQIIRGAGLDTFITNKISWCERNKFPHVSFDWVGIDGTSVLTHLTPGHNYNSSILPADLQFAERNVTELDQAAMPTWLQPYGFGDGGGGPTVEQTERIELMAEGVEGLPAVEFGRADDFCGRLHEEAAGLRSAGGEPARWDGELYLELHRGTYTSHQWLKQANAEAESALRTIELMGCGVPDATPESTAALRDRLDATWKLVLLNQFHDILPGSSIPEVYVDARAQYETIRSACREELDAGLDRWAGSLDAAGLDQPVLIVNPASTPRGGVVNVDGELLPIEPVPATGGRLVDASRLHAVEPVLVEERSMGNGRIEVAFDEAGRVIRLGRVGGASINGSDERGRVRPLNRFRLYEDRPRRWEAWDLDRDYHEKFEELTSDAARHAVIESGPLRGAIEFEHAIGRSSRLVVRYVLDAGADRLDVRLLVDWQEDRTLLRAEFPTGIRARSATFGIPFGAIERATHRNTSWEEARFEVPGRRWMDLSQPGLGFAVLDAGIVGRNAHRSTLGLSLLRSPGFPDPTCDRGTHRLGYALMPHGGDRFAAGVDAEAEAFAEPLIVHRPSVESTCAGGESNIIPVQHEVEGAARVEVVAYKPSEDGSGTILRVVEKHGAAGTVTIRVPGQATAGSVDLMEAGIERPGLEWNPESSEARFPIRPFEIVSLRFGR